MWHNWWLLLLAILAACDKEARRTVSAVGKCNTQLGSLQLAVRWQRVDLVRALLSVVPEGTPLEEATGAGSSPGRQSSPSADSPASQGRSPPPIVKSRSPKEDRKALLDALLPLSEAEIRADWLDGQLASDDPVLADVEEGTPGREREYSI